MKSEKRYPELKYLMEHFHQDWRDDFKSDADLLRDFARKNPPAIVEQTIADIHRVTTENADSRKVDALLTREWQAETPYSSPQEALDWLKQAAKILQGNRRLPKETESPPGVSSTIETYPGLYLLMSNFDEHWKAVFETEENVLRHFRKANSKQDVEACVGDIHKILDANFSDKELDQLLRKDFRGRPPYKTANEARAWLRRVLTVYRNFKPGVWK